MGTIFNYGTHRPKPKAMFPTLLYIVSMILFLGCGQKGLQKSKLHPCWFNSPTVWSSKHLNIINHQSISIHLNSISFRTKKNTKFLASKATKKKSLGAVPGCPGARVLVPFWKARYKAGRRTSGKLACPKTRTVPGPAGMRCEETYNLYPK